MVTHHVQLLSLEKKFAWTIGNFTQATEKIREPCHSPSFTAGVDGNHVIHFELYPNGETQNCKDHIAIYLFIYSSSISKITASFKFSLQKQNGEEINVREHSHTFRKKLGWGYEKFI